MARPSVAVVVPGAERGEASLPMARALERQTRRPERLVVLDIGPAGRHEDLLAGLAGDTDWMWLLDGSAVPEPTALERLLDTLDRLDGLPPAVLLASKVTHPDGSLDRSALPVAQVGDPDLGVAAFERRLLSLRVARGGALLVHRSGIEAVAAGWPRLSPFHDDLEWTARLLKGRLGVLVPTSVAVRSPEAGGNRRQPAHREVARRVRLLLGDAVDRADKPWFAFRFAEEGLAQLRNASRWRGRG